MSNRRAWVIRDSFCVVVFACLLAAAKSGRAQTPAIDPMDWKTYQSEDYGFTVRYPGDFALWTVRLKYPEAASVGYIPVCRFEPVACFVYAGHEYDGTNFSGAALSISVLRDKRTDEACADMDLASSPAKIVTINGTSFHYAVTGEGAAGHSMGGNTFRTLYQGVCFELAANIGASNFANYDPGTIKEFHPERMSKELDAIVRTFKFVGPVTDGAAWQAYHNPEIGGDFEYPDGDSVATLVEYSNERRSSNEISDARYFVDHGIRYVVSAKVNLKDEKALNAWLASAGFPDLSAAREVSDSGVFREYVAGNYHFFYGQAKLYILSVTDLQGKVVPPPDNRVYRHFVKTFRPQ